MKRFALLLRRPALPRALGLVLLLLTACKRTTPSAVPANPPPVTVRSAAVRSESIRTSVSVAGTVRAVDRATISARISGVIESLPLTLGQTVRRGDLLARIAAPEYSARLAQSRAQLDQAIREEQRTRNLAATGADTTDAALSAADRLRSARAALAEAEAMHSYTEIRAPFDGRVAEKPAYAGDLAVPGQPLLVLESPTSFQVEAAIPASLAASFRLADVLQVRVADISELISCPVTEIAAAADPASRTVLVRLSIPAATPALSGRFARIDLPGAPAHVLLISASAVTRFGQIERIFVVAEGRAQLRLVKTGAVRGDDVELLAGANAGERVVLSPPSALRDGQPVTLTP